MSIFKNRTSEISEVVKLADYVKNSMHDTNTMGMITGIGYMAKCMRIRYENDEAVLSEIDRIEKIATESIRRDHPFITDIAREANK